MPSLPTKDGQNDRLQSSTRRRYRPGMIVAMVIATLLIPAHAGGVPDSLFGNYHGAGKCPPAAKPCIDTGPLDNLYIGPAHIKQETAEEQRLRESFQIPKETPADAFIAIRVLRKFGDHCTMEGEAFWSGGRLAFQDKPPYGAKICVLQLSFNKGVVAIKDPAGICAWKFCSADKPIKLAGRRFQKGPDQLLSAQKKSLTPPPKTIYGKYIGTGKCATDQRKLSVCRETEKNDYVVIQPNDTSDARVVLGRLKGTADNTDYFCLQGAEGVWLGDRLAVTKDMPETPGRPHLLELAFKDDTVVVSNVWNDHCGTYIQGSYFKKTSTP